jgi:D-alanine-D-alanine ligase-like ATP-grasp enzyme
LLKIYSKDNLQVAKEFFKKNKIKKAVVKPATGGSSIGVFLANTPIHVILKAEIIFSKRMDTRVVIEPYIEGKEFTVIVLENSLGLPVAILPTEIELAFHEGRIFDFRKKYLPTNQVKYHCPPRFKDNTIDSIRRQAQQLFLMYGMKDFARFDGWILGDKEIFFSDFNTISGMEQNSFLFQQASRIGMTHSDLLKYIVKNSCKRQNIDFPEESKKSIHNNKRKSVSVIFGGSTSERQVSLMSGTNVWLKLRQSEIYEPKPYLLDFEGDVWELPYSLILNHTVEEIIENVKNADKDQQRIKKLVNVVLEELRLLKNERTEPFFIPRKLSFSEFARNTKFVFIGLHGGSGEDGTIQKKLTEANIKYNGSGEEVSKLCMDKFATGKFIRNLKMKGLTITSQKVLPFTKIKNYLNSTVLWDKLTKELNAKTLIVKPRDDGCSTGIAHLYSHRDLGEYMKHMVRCDSHIPAGTLRNQEGILEMPGNVLKDLLFEKFIKTDIVQVKGNKLKYRRKNGTVEVTIGILEEGKKLYSLNPSITIAEGEVLSLEEKFQSGTGINLTPPPEDIVSVKALANSKAIVRKFAEKIGIKGYARIDAFMNVKTGELSVIEINTLPGLTPSTVFFHQALAENPQIFPRALLEKIIKNAGY